MLDHTVSSSRAWPAFVLLLLVGLVGMLTPSSGWAYQDAEAPEAAPAVPAAPPDAPAADAPATDAPAADTPAAAPRTESFLAWMIRASGIFGLFLLILSFVMVALIVMNVLQIRRENLLPIAFIEAFEAKLQGKDYQGAYEIARSDDSFIARMLAAGLSKLNRGHSEAVVAMQEVAEESTMDMDHRLNHLALIASLGPMLGLMGTVQGMIASFSLIAQSDVAPKPKDLADGISTALFTTLEGLAVAIPAMISYSLLRNRMDKYLLEIGTVSEGLMSRFSTVGKKAGGVPATTPE